MEIENFIISETKTINSLVTESQFASGGGVKIINEIIDLNQELYPAERYIENSLNNIYENKIILKHFSCLNTFYEYYTSKILDCNNELIDKISQDKKLIVFNYKK